MCASLSNCSDCLSNAVIKREHTEFTAFPCERIDIELTIPAVPASLLTSAEADLFSKQVPFLALLHWYARILLQHCRGRGAPSEAGPSSGSRAPRRGNKSPGDRREKPLPGKRGRQDVRKGKKGGAGGGDNNESGDSQSGSEDSGDEDSDDTAVSRPPAKRKKRPKGPKLVCPFFRLNPRQYVSCADFNLADYEAVRTHMKRKHMSDSDIHCPFCYTFFQSEREKNMHVVQTASGGVSCVAAVDGHDEITTAEWNRVFHNKQDRPPRTTTCEKKYLWMWTKLFEGHPQLSPEDVYLQDFVVEAKHLFSVEGILSNLEAHLPLNQPATPQLASAIREGLIRSDPGPRRYRVRHLPPTSAAQNNCEQGPSVDSTNHFLEPPSPCTQVLEQDDTDAGHQGSMAECLLPPQAALLGHGDPPPPSPAVSVVDTPPVVTSVGAVQTTMENDVPVAAAQQAGPSLGSMQTQQPSLGDPGIEGAVVPELATYGLLLTHTEAWSNILATPISPNSSYSWWQAAHCIDWPAWEESLLSLRSMPWVTVPIPIRPSHVAEFRAMQSAGSIDQGSASSGGDGAGEFVPNEGS